MLTSGEVLLAWDNAIKAVGSAYESLKNAPDRRSGGNFTDAQRIEMSLTYAQRDLERALEQVTLLLADEKDKT